MVGSALQAFGHASLAAGAGLLARGLAGGRVLVAERVAMRLPSIGATTQAGDFVMVLGGFGVLAALLKLVGGALAASAEATVAAAVAGDVRLAVLDRVLALREGPLPRHTDHGSDGTTRVSTRADQLSALTSHVAEVERGVSEGVLSEARAIAQLVPLTCLLILLAPRLAGSAALVLGAFGALAFGLRRAFRRARERASIHAAALIHAADEAVTHAEVWATYGAQKKIRAHVVRVGRAIAEEAARLRLRASLLSSTSEMLGALALLLVLLLRSRGLLGVEQATVAPFAIAFFMAYRPLRELVDARLTKGRAEVALRAALSMSPSTTNHHANADVLARRWTLEPLTLSNVKTGYGSHAPISLVVPAGSIVALVGPTGVGKSSLLRVLLGLDALSEGEVRYGDVSLTFAGVGPFERPFAWVPQDAPVVGDSLHVNLALGFPNDRALDPAKVLAELGCEGLAEALGSAELMTVRPLSGGERQWIAMARALATEQPVLLLDEPTSALDQASQARLLVSLERLRGRRTILLVTHRPEPLAICDHVLYLGTNGSDEDRVC